MSGQPWLRRATIKARRAAVRMGFKIPKLPPEQRFHAMTESTDADWSGILLADAAYGKQLPDRLMTMMRMLAGEPHGFAIDRLQHALQTATRALREGEDDGYVVCALLHDIGATIAPEHHAEVAANILQPYVSEADHWMVAHHDIFQGYYFAQHIGRDRDAREAFRGHPHFEHTARFCHRYDQSAFNPDYETLPLEAFEPALRQVLAHYRR